MHASTGITLEKIPALRLAISNRWDIPVNLPNGQSDWAGDSARKAVRVSGWCQPNMILVDYTVLDMIFRDFQYQALKEEEWPPEYRPKRDEQIVPKYILGDLKPEPAADSNAPAYFVEMLKAIGKREEAAEFTLDASSCLENEAEKSRREGQFDFNPILVRWNRLLGYPLRTYQVSLRDFSKHP